MPGSAGGARESCAKSDWLVERTGFEPPSLVDFAAGHHGLNHATDEDSLREQTATCHMGMPFDDEVGY